MAIQPTIAYDIFTTAEEQWVQSGAAGNIKLIEVTTPTGTASGVGLLYVKSSDSKLYYQNDSGTETDLTAAATGAAGSDTQVQFNDGGTNLGGDAGFTYNKTTDAVTVGTANITRAIITGTATISGNLGIGTTNPTLAKLQIEAGNGVVGQYINGGNIIGTDLLKLRANVATQRLILEGAGGIVQTFLESGGSVGLFGTVTNHDFRIRTNYTDRLSITSTGNVGIGTTTPAYLLDINGTVEVRNFLIRGNSGTATISTLNLTADRTFSLPDSSGTAYITGGTDVAVVDGGTGGSTAGDARTNLGLAIGTNVQAWDNDLDDLAALTHTGSAMIISNGTDWIAHGTAAIRADLDIIAATLTKEGIIEIATATETTAGTDATRAVSPDALADSDYGKRILQVLITNPNDAAQGYGTSFVRIDSVLNNYRLVGMESGIATGSASAGGGISITPRNMTKGYNMVSEPVWIDANESDSSTAATAVVIPAGSASVSTGDKIRLSIGGTGTATGIIGSLIFQI